MPYAARGYYAGRYSGGGVFDKLKRAARKANDIAKKTQIVSKVLSEVNNPTAQRIASIAATHGYGYVGYGRRRRRSGRRARFPKGSAEAKAYMAYLRSLRRRR